MAQPFPDARLSDPLTNEGGVADLRAGTQMSKLTEQPVRLQAHRGWLLSDHRSIAAPRPVASVRDHRGAHWIEHDVSRQFQQVGISFDQDGFETTLQEVAHQPMAAIGRLRKNAGFQDLTPLFSGD